MRSRLLHHSKQPFPKLVTDLGMVMAVKLLQPARQSSPKLVTEYVIPL